MFVPLSLHVVAGRLLTMAKRHAILFYVILGVFSIVVFIAFAFYICN